MSTRTDEAAATHPRALTGGPSLSTSTQLLSEWKTFLGIKFQRPAADAHQNLESLSAEDDVLDDDELSVCQRLYAAGKLRDGTLCQ